MDGSETVLSCKITGITAAVTVSWTPADSGVVSQGTLDGDFQISTLTISTPSQDLSYTCTVTSGLLSNSPPSQTTVNLNHYCEFLYIKVLDLCRYNGLTSLD